MRQPVGGLRRLLSRRLAALLGAALVVLLAGCQRFPPPTPVAFPDDPRVLNGAWQARVTGLATGEVSGFVHAPESQRIVVWQAQSVRQYRRDATEGWLEDPVAPSSALQANQYDPTLEAFVAASLKTASSSIRVTPVNGDPAITSLVELPAGRAVTAVAFGSGRTFALTTSTTDTGGHTLSWWDSSSGAFGGSHDIARMRDGMRVSPNGRLLAFWDLDSYRVSIVDTADPSQLRDLGLGACRSNSEIAASADGRWFVFADCFDNLRVADLSATGKLVSRGIGIKPQGRVSFAADTSELVWVDSQGVVSGYDVPDGSRTELLRLTESELQGFDPWHPLVHLDRSADLLAIVTGRGTARVQSLNEPAQASELPRLAVSAGVLDLAALADSLSGHADWWSYDFAGTLQVIGEGIGGDKTLGEALSLTGTVHSDRLHSYRLHALVLAGSLKPASLAPPNLRGQAAALDPATGEESYHLTFRTEDRAATAFDGLLEDVAGGISYRVVVERVGAAEQYAAEQY
ncbi:MAG TPA: hypothetical protein VFD39_00740 [Trueperaceae bacterium]|nr:hypothetical protein [Trueperaceae bacterium]